MTTREKNRELRHCFAGENAKEAIGGIKKGMSLFCLTKGDFNKINIIEHILDEIGSADVVVCTWAAGGFDVKKLKALHDSGRVNNISIILDKSAISKLGADRFKIITELFPNEVYPTSTHAKFILIRNEEFHIVVRTSMNLNENKRIENFEIDDDRELYNYIELVIKDIIKKNTYSVGTFKLLGKDEQFNKYIPALSEGNSGLRDKLKDTDVLDEELQKKLNITKTEVSFLLTKLHLKRCPACWFLVDRFENFGKEECEECKALAETG